MEQPPAAFRPRAIITGSNSGLGFVTASRLAGEGHSVVLAVRDLARGADASDRIRAEHADADVAVLRLDLSSLSSVREFAALFAERFSAWDVLINNAGVMLHPERTITADGFELHFGVNHLGHFALTGLLLPFAAPRARVVTVTSLAHRFDRLHFYDLRHDHGYSPMRAYGTSKLANLLFARELQRKADRDGLDLLSVAVHPGYSIGERKAGMVARAERIIAQSYEAGAQPAVFAATDPGIVGGELIGPDGAFQTRGTPKQVRSTRKAEDELTAKRLWRISGQLTRVAW